MTSFGLLMMNSGAPTTGMRNWLKTAGKVIRRPPVPCR
jgi:hypothetical protein